MLNGSLAKGSAIDGELQLRRSVKVHAKTEKTVEVQKHLNM